MFDFEELYRANFKRLCAKAYRITLDRTAAEDIVQDAFLTLWKQKSANVEFREAYLYRSVINGSLNHIKKHKRLESLPDEPNLSIDQTPLTSLQSKELQEKIQTTINSLPPACREVFLLSRYEQMSYQEIASFLNISVNTVEKHIGKALLILRDAVSDDGRS